MLRGRWLAAATRPKRPGDLNFLINCGLFAVILLILYGILQLVLSFR